MHFILSGAAQDDYNCFCNEKSSDPDPIIMMQMLLDTRYNQDEKFFPVASFYRNKYIQHLLHSFILVSLLYFVLFSSFVFLFNLCGISATQSLLLTTPQSGI